MIMNAPHKTNLDSFTDYELDGKPGLDSLLKRPHYDFF